ncbi:plasmid partition protein ParG [Aeromonas salmonicida]|uniref:plasmid partition protein ParG n=1 Tax=Aeromonas salmonicida TaxID=645 RepID=UPI00232B35BB|nr:plasmid partition protein ParG [Aeromonas salmonicida]WCH42149.1 plasmid partition protein ParG [Aeromonas salmonicida]
MLKAGRPSVKKQVNLKTLELAKRRVNFDIDENTHSKLKVYAAENGKTIKDVIVDCIETLLAAESGSQKA